MKKKLAILAATATMTMALAAGPASANKIVVLDDHGDVDEVVHDFDGHRFLDDDDLFFLGGGLVFLDDCEGPVCLID
jgi:hypothetical protein